MRNQIIEIIAFGYKLKNLYKLLPCHSSRTSYPILLSLPMKFL